VVHLHGFDGSLIEDPVLSTDRDSRAASRHAVFKYAAAATIVVAFMSIGWLTYHQWDRASVIHTNVGEQRSVVLEDGTTVYLNTDTVVAARISDHERRIRLTHGEARFTVAKDPNRPFFVTTPQAVVKALGTAFNVRIIDERTVVSVIEGHIKVVRRDDGDAVAESEKSNSLQVKNPNSHSAIELFANGQVSVQDSGSMVDNGGPPFDRAVGWTQRRIIVHDEPLTVLTSEFNRYNEQQLEVADMDLAQQKINGSFDAFDRASFLDFLQRYQGVRIDEEDGKLMMRRATQPRPGS
jgi:transmembrane sensor